MANDIYVDEQGQKWLGPLVWLVRDGNWREGQMCLFKFTTEEAAREVTNVLNKHLESFDPYWLYTKPFTYVPYKGLRIVPDREQQTK